MAPSMKAVCALYGDCSGLFARPFSVRVAMKLLGDVHIDTDSAHDDADLEQENSGLGLKMPKTARAQSDLNRIKWWARRHRRQSQTQLLKARDVPRFHEVKLSFHRVVLRFHEIKAS